MCLQYKKYTNIKKSHDHVRYNYKINTVWSKEIAIHNCNENYKELQVDDITSYPLGMNMLLMKCFDDDDIWEFKNQELKKLKKTHKEFARND